MKNFKKIVALLLTAALFISMLAGISMFAAAEEKAPLSQTYKEATELMTSLGLMDNKTVEWTAPITAEEANTVIFKLYYEPLQRAAASAGQDWAFTHLENHGKSEFRSGETITAAKLMGNAFAGCGFPDDLETELVDYFHLLKGLPDSVTKTSTANLTREQAAQIFLNVLKCNVFYNPDCLKCQDTNLEIRLVSAGETAKHYPKYYWEDKNGKALTDVYVDTPILETNGGLMWSEIFAQFFVSENLSNRGAKLAVSVNENGAGYGAIEQHSRNDQDAAFKTAESTLLFFDNYHMQYHNDDIGGLDSFAREYLVFCKFSTEGQSANYPQATELMTALEVMKADGSSDWTDNIQAAEANKVIEDLFFTPRGMNFGDREGAIALTDKDAITVRRVALLAIEGCCASGSDWLEYFHILKGLPDNSLNKVCTREMAAQIFMNVLKVNPTNASTKKMADYLNIKLVPNGLSDDKAPLYFWAKSDDTPITNTYADIPVAEITGGVPYSTVLTTVGAIPGLKDIGFHAAFRFTKDGTTFDSYAGHYQGEAYKLCQSNTDILTIYDAYVSKSFISLPVKGYFRAYDVYVKAGDTSISPEYETAVKVVKKALLMEVGDPLWKRPLKGKEANKILNALYNAIPAKAKEYSQVPKNWVSPFTDNQDVTAHDFLVQSLQTVGWTYNPGADHWIEYLHLIRDVDEYKDNLKLTREQAAQLVVNVLKSNPSYEPDKLKAAEFSLELVQVDEDELCRPMYEWRKSGSAFTEPELDTPLLIAKGDVSWNKLLGELNNGSSFQFPADISISEEGAPFTDFVTHQWGDGNGGSSPYTAKWTLEFYADYHPENHEQQGYLVIATTKQIAEVKPTTWYGHSDAAIAYSGNVDGDIALEIDGNPVDSSDFELNPEEQFIILSESYLSTLISGKHTVKIIFSPTENASSVLEIIETGTMDTIYPEAVELLCNIEYMDGSNHNWQEPITAAEANTLLQKLYASVHWQAPWVYDYDRTEVVTGRTFTHKCLITSGWNYQPTAWWAAYNKLDRGLCSDYFEGAALTREQAAQIALNTLKSSGAYGDYATIKGSDKYFKMDLIKVWSDEMGRPSYKWQKDGVDLTGVYQDSPLAMIRGGCSWGAIMDACGNRKEIGRSEYFSYNINGGSFYGFELKQFSTETFSNRDRMLEIYSDYSHLHSEKYSYIILSYDSSFDPPIEPDVTVPDLKTKRTTMYPEAVELASNVGYMNGDNNDWQAPISADEANKVLNWLYSGPGFIEKWESNYNSHSKITGESFISGVLRTIGWNYNNDKQWSSYLHIEKGLKSNYSATKPLTREQAAQIVLNALKTEVTYNLVTAKYQDPRFHLHLVKTGEDQYHRPSYKWQLGAMDVTKSYPDTPIVVIQGGISFNNIMTAIGNPSYVNRVTGFRWSKDGGPFTEYVDTLHKEDAEIFLDNTWLLELYFDYSRYAEEQFINILCLKEGAASSIGLSNQELLGKKFDTIYPEAVEVCVNGGIMDGENENWKELLTYQEANDILTLMYAAPNFIDPWEPGYTSDNQVTGATFAEKAMITTGWNYGRSEMFGEYNHIAKGIVGYNSKARITREQAAQILLNTLKIRAIYNRETIKANDPGLGLALVKSGEDAQHRNYYKWQKNGLDITNSYLDPAVTTIRGGITVNEFLIAIGDVGDVNIPAAVSFSKNGGPFSAYEEYVMLNFNRVLDMNWIMEIYCDYDLSHQEQGYRVLCFSGKTFEGTAATWGGKGPLTVSSPAPFEEFMNVVTLNGYNIPEEYYKASKGSTNITFSERYLQTLPAGEHTIGILSESGVTYATLTIPEKEEAEDVITPMDAAAAEPTAAPAAEAPAAEPAAAETAAAESAADEAAEAAEAPTEEASASSSAWIWIVIAVVVVAAAAIVLLRKKSKKA